ncbi:MAG: hypothetical protein KIS66_11375 [Fimbriimonadaceae bacterium]|nr:hypothetical protein [Fimbriimonadaceae bacterium]
MPTTSPLDPQRLEADLQAFVAALRRARGGDAVSLDPGHRVPFRWPPPSVLHRFPVRDEDARTEVVVAMGEEPFEVEVVETPAAVVARCDALWLDAHGPSVDEALAELADRAEPLLRRQRLVARMLGLEGRHAGPISELGPLEHLKLLYCEDRDIGHEAQVAIETLHERRALFPALLSILRDRSHPFRRAAQWAVLDLFEDLPSFCDSRVEELRAVAAMKSLLWDAEDDYCRTVYKAGVVLGGQVPLSEGGDALIECLRAPSRIGRRSATHGLFHVVEWQPERRGEVVGALRRAAAQEAEPALRVYAEAMARDIEAERLDHIVEPTFPDEGP